MNSLQYSSRQNPLMQLLAWETAVIRLLLNETASPREELRPPAQVGAAGQPAPATASLLIHSAFLRTFLDHRRDAFLLARIARRRGLDFVCRQPLDYIDFREELARSLRRTFATKTTTGNRPVHRLQIPLVLSRFLKFGADLWELKPGVETRLLAIIDEAVDQYCGNQCLTDEELP